MSKSRSARARLAAALANPVSRRRFLQLLGASAVAACGGDGPSTPTDTGLDGGLDSGLDSGLDAAMDAMDATDVLDAADACCGDVDWFGAMERLRDAFRASPDHLANRARDLVEAGDPEALLAFVRNEIRLVPAGDDALTQFNVDRMHWGPDGALRAGRGTQRTRAELLARLYREAGFEAEVYTGVVALTADELRGMMLGAPSSSAPAIDVDELVAMADGLGASTDESLDTQFADLAQAEALADAILATMPDEILDAAPWLGDGFEDWVTLVAVTIDGAQQWANPNHPTAPFGDAGTENDPIPVDRGPSTDDVEVRLEWVKASDPDDPIVLVAGTWPATEVVGRRLQAVLQPLGDFDHFATADAQSQREFVPMLAFEKRPDEEGPESERGDAVTIDGLVMDIDEDAETISIDGAPIRRGEGSAAAARVASIEATATPVGWPDVRVRFAARDADGLPVEGLEASVIEVSDDGERVPFLLTANTQARPRVLFLVDNSGSVDEGFRGAALTPRLRAIIDGVVAERPDAEFAVEMINFGISDNPSWTTDADTIAETVEGSFADGSEIWSASATAQRTGATVAVLISDGQPSDEADDVVRDALGGGVPVICVHATSDGTGRDVMDEIASLSGGRVISIDDPDAVAGEVADGLVAPLESFYSLTFRSLATTGGARTVDITIVGGPSAEAEYTAPEAVTVVQPDVPIGLYYTLRVGDREVRRTLAGWTPVGFESPDEADFAEYARDVRENAMAGVSLHFEAGAPTNAVLMDDLLTSRVSMRGFEPFIRGDLPATAMEAALLDTTVPAAPGALDILSGTPDRVGDVPVYPLGLCVVATGAHARILDDEMAERTGWHDLLPVSRYAAYGPDVRASVRATAIATALQALWEAGTFETSTASLLRGRTLAALTPFGGLSDLDVEVSEEDQRTFARMLDGLDGEWAIVDASGDPIGAWIVDPRTGAIIGRLPNARGGAEFRAQLNYLKNVLGWASWLGGVTGALSPAYGGLMAIVIFHIKMWTIADACIGSLTPVSDTRVDREIANLLCDIVRAFGVAAMGPGAGGVDALWGLVENIIGTSLCEAITNE